MPYLREDQFHLEFLYRVVIFQFIANLVFSFDYANLFNQVIICKHSFLRKFKHWNRIIAYLFPCSGRVCFSGPVHGSLVLSQVDESGGQSGKIGDVIEEKFGRFVQPIVEASIADLTEEENLTHKRFLGTNCREEPPASKFARQAVELNAYGIFT